MNRFPDIPEDVREVHMPFFPSYMVYGNKIEQELVGQMTKMSEYYELPLSELGASIQLLPDPEHPGEHFLTSQVTYYR